MQRMTMIPAIVWAALWIGISIITLIYALKRYAERVVG
jgi:hypothetical protein